jgi:hypothetical protein
VYKVLVGKPKENKLLEGRGVDGRTGSVSILGRLTAGVWSGFSWLRIWWRAFVNIVMNLRVLVPHS